jgi:hypothetical protein
MGGSLSLKLLLEVLDLGDPLSPTLDDRCAARLIALLVSI